MRAVLLVALLACLAVAGLLPGPAGAHSRFADLATTGDGALRLEFTGDLESALLRVDVRDRADAPLAARVELDARDARAVLVRVDEPERAALVRWRVLSRDGHAQGGAASVADGAPVAGERAGTRDQNGPLPLLARLLALLGPILVGGLVLAWGWVLAPAVAAGGLAPPGGARDAAQFAGRTAPARARAAGRGRRAAVWALGGWALGLVLVPPALLWTLGAGAGDLGDLLTGTRAGLAWWVQVAGLALAAGSLVVGWRRGGGADGPGAVAAALAAGGAALALGALSWAGHASSGKDATANILIDAVHNLATGAWVGGLLALVALWPAVMGVGDAGDRVRLGAAVVVRFSALAVAAVATLVVTGIYRALAELGSAADLLDTDYGLALLVKLVLFGALLALGALNRFVVHPRLERAALGLDDSERAAGALLARSVRAEVVLAVAVVAAVAVMIGFPPPQ